MAARRYRRPRAGPTLRALLVFTVLEQKPPARLPGQPYRPNQNLKCPYDGSLLVRKQDGTYRCQKKGHFFKDPPQTSSS